MSSETAILLSLGLTMVFGLASTRLMKIFHLPNVTGYLITGVLIGYSLWKLMGVPSVAVISESLANSFTIITDLALGFIAFSIGGEFKLSTLKKLGKSVFIITILQSGLACLAVDGALMIYTAITGTFRNNLSLTLCLGAIATATAPAATLMVVRQYQAKGPVTETLLPVVALDDAVGLVIFSISFALAKAFNIYDAVTPSVMTMLVDPILEITLSLGIGAALGALVALCCRWFKSRHNRLIVMIAATTLGVALDLLINEKTGLEMSSLLTCMMIGFMLANMRQDALEIMDLADRWTPAIYMLFFVISSAKIDLSVIPAVGVIGIIYLIVRSLGKYFGARLGGKLVHADPNVQKYLGPCLLPQAGVAIGMATMCSKALTGFGSQILAVVLTATLIYELVGPVLTKISLEKAGEIKKEPKTTKTVKTA